MQCIGCERTIESLSERRDCPFFTHVVQRAMCDDLEKFCASPELWVDTERAQRLHAFFSREVPNHVADQEQDLLPRLKEHGLIEEPAAEWASTVAGHSRDKKLGVRVAKTLAQVAEGRKLDDPTRLLVAGVAFAHSYRKHLDMELKVLLPLVCQLPDDDRSELREGMAARRT